MSPTPASAGPASCDFVVFGGTGDLALRKLLPALFLRDAEDQLADDARIIGVSRAEVDDAAYRAGARAGLAAHVPDADPVAVDRFLARLHHVPLEFDDAEGWHLLHGVLKKPPAGRARPGARVLPRGRAQPLRPDLRAPRAGRVPSTSAPAW